MTKRSELNIAAIYRITCTPTGKTYVGQARNVRKRWMHHKWHLARGLHRNTHLQNAWKKHGSAAFEFAVVKTFDGLDGDDLTNAMALGEVDVLRRYPDTFNLMQVGEPSLIASDETRQKLSEFNTAKWQRPGYRERLRATHLEKHADPEWAARRAAALREGMSTPEYRASRAASTSARWEPGGDLRETQSAMRTELWKDPEHRELQSRARRASWAKNHDSRVEGLKRAWADPEKREARRQKFAVAMAAKPGITNSALSLAKSIAPASITVELVADAVFAALGTRPDSKVVGSTLYRLGGKGALERTEEGWRWPS